MVCISDFNSELLFQNFLRLAKSNLLWMFCMMLWKVRNIEHGKRYMSQLCWNTWNFVWIFARATWLKRDYTSIRTSVSRYVWTELGFICLISDFSNFQSLPFKVNIFYIIKFASKIFYGLLGKVFWVFVFVG